MHSTTSGQDSQNLHPKEDPAVQNLLKRMPEGIANSFSTEQLIGLRHSLGIRGGRAHSIDIRPTLKLPFVPWSFYFVFLLGKDKRRISENEKLVAVALFLLVLLLFGFGLFAVCLIILYLVKSALGIDLFEGYSTGFWDWFKETFSNE